MAKKDDLTLTAAGTTLLNGAEVPFATYKVQPGDTVFGLWLRFRAQTTVGGIKTANGIETNELKPGKTIKIPLVA